MTQREIAQSTKRLKDDDWNIRFSTLDTLQKITADVKLVPVLIAILNYEDRILFLKAANVLSQIGEPAVPALMRALKEGRSHRQERATYTLGKMGKSAVPALIKALQDRQDSVRQAAAVALTAIGYHAIESVPALTVVINGDNSPVQAQAIQALCSIGPEAKAAAPSLINMAQDKDNPLRKEAAYALVKIGFSIKSTVSIFIEDLKSRHRFEQSRAIGSLSMMGPDAAEAASALIVALQDRPGYFPQVSRALVRIGQPAVFSLIELLKHGVTSVRQVAPRILGMIGPDASASTPALIDSIKYEEDRLVRSRAARAIRKIILDINEATRVINEAQEERVKYIRQKRVLYSPANGRIYDAPFDLRPREKKILQLRFGMVDGRRWTLKEVVKKFRLSRERIRQIQAEALHKLRGDFPEKVSLYSWIVKNHSIGESWEFPSTFESIDNSIQSAMIFTRKNMKATDHISITILNDRKKVVLESTSIKVVNIQQIGYSM